MKMCAHVEACEVRCLALVECLEGAVEVVMRSQEVDLLPEEGGVGGEWGGPMGCCGSGVGDMGGAWESRTGSSLRKRVR